MIDQGRKSRYKSQLDVLDYEYGTTRPATLDRASWPNCDPCSSPSGNCRRYCNTQTRHIIRIFRHAVSRELIDVSIVTELETLAALRPGQARESKPRQPANLNVVRATNQAHVAHVGGYGAGPVSNGNAARSKSARWSSRH